MDTEYRLYPSISSPILQIQNSKRTCDKQNTFNKPWSTSNRIKATNMYCIHFHNVTNNDHALFALVNDPFIILLMFVGFLIITSGLNFIRVDYYAKIHSSQHRSWP